LYFNNDKPAKWQTNLYILRRANSHEYRHFYWFSPVSQLVNQSVCQSVKYSPCQLESLSVCQALILLYWCRYSSMCPQKSICSVLSMADADVGLQIQFPYPFVLFHFVEHIIFPEFVYSFYFAHTFHSPLDVFSHWE